MRTAAAPGSTVISGRPAIHVDLVRNIPRQGVQQLVARVVDEDGLLDVQVYVEGGYQDTIKDVMGRADAADAAAVLDRLGEVFASDYLFATAPHAVNECPFAHGHEVAMVVHLGNPFS